VTTGFACCQISVKFDRVQGIRGLDFEERDDANTKHREQGIEVFTDVRTDESLHWTVHEEEQFMFFRFGQDGPDKHEGVFRELARSVDECRIVQSIVHRTDAADERTPALLEKFRPGFPGLFERSYYSDTHWASNKQM